MSGIEQRKYWLDTMLRIGTPVLEALAARKLKEQLPAEFHSERSQFAHLEAFCKAGLRNGSLAGASGA
ncbi:hypothetical protein ACFSQ7_16350 [Paenibacillus rhizoplanae]